MSLWKIKQSALPKTVDIYIYSDIEADDYDWWSGEKIESDTSANHFKNELEKIGEIDSINIYINSLGGSVVEGVAIYNQLKRHKAYKTVYIDGFACSVASVIAMAGDKIVMPRNTNMMIHNAWTISAGNANQLRKTAEDLDVINESSRQAYLIKAGEKLSEAKLIELMDDETYLTAMQCVEYGLADEFANTEADIDAAKSSLDQAKYQAFQKKFSFKAEIPDITKLVPPIQPDPPRQCVPDAAIRIMTAFLNSTLKTGD